MVGVIGVKINSHAENLKKNTLRARAEEIILHQWEDLCARIVLSEGVT